MRAVGPSGGVTALALRAGLVHSLLVQARGEGHSLSPLLASRQKENPSGHSKVVAQHGHWLQLHGMAWHGSTLHLRWCKLPIVGVLLLEHPLCTHQMVFRISSSWADAVR